MAAGNPTVKVIFAGDSASLEAAQKRVAAGAEAVSHRLKDTSTQAKYLKTSLAGAGNAAALFGGSLGNTAVNAGYALVAVKDLGKGLGGMSKSLTGAQVAVGGVYAVIGELGLALAAHVDHTSQANVAARTFADTGYYLTKALSFTAQGVPVLGGALKSLNRWFDDASNHAHGLVGELGTLQEQFAKTLAYQNALHQPTDTNPGGDAFFTAADAQDIATQAYRSQTPGYADVAKKSGSGGASAVKSQANAVAQAAKEAATKLKQARASVAAAMGGILAAFAGHLEAGDPGADLMVGGRLLSASNGTGLIDKLRKQATDTKHLADDLKKLSHMGLSKGLLSDLVTGGLGSLGAADELLKGGKSSISTANSLNASITSSGTQIAAGEVNRNLTKQDRVQVDLNVTGGEDALKKLVRKWIRTDGANSFGLVGTA